MSLRIKFVTFTHGIVLSYTRARFVFLFVQGSLHAFQESAWGFFTGLFIFLVKASYLSASDLAHYSLLGSTDSTRPGFLLSLKIFLLTLTSLHVGGSNGSAQNF